MYVKCALTILLAVTIESTYSVIADKGKFEFVKPSPIDELPDDRRLADFKESPEDTSDKRYNSEKLDSEKTKDSRQEKKPRTIFSTPETPDSADNPHCCGSRYEGGSSPSRQESGQGSKSGLRAHPSDTGRYPSRYGNRPEDSYGWQSYNPGSSGRRGSVGSSSGLGLAELYGGSPGGTRYGTRPSYYGGENDYDRPSTSENRPVRPAHGYGGNGYGDSGAHGSNGYEVSRPGGGGYGNRPQGGINFNAVRPGGSTYGGGGGGGYGIYGTIGEQEGEFPGQDDNGPDGGPQPHPGAHNLQTQKAVALKALAGVALIGAAAALATNPVLLPIGMLAGRRRRRSVNSSSRIDDIDIYKLMKLLEDHVPKIYKEKIKKQALNSPTCVARLACEIQQQYKTEKKNNNDHENRINAYESLKKHLANLIQSKILDDGIIYKNIKRLMKSAEAYDGKCNVFVCDFTKD